MQKAYFITGTDTNAGKTWATVTLMHYFKRQGKSVIGMKPIASGCTIMQGKLKNADALSLQENASVPIDYDLINPYAYQLPISPHLAGQHNPAQLNKIISHFKQLQNLADVVLVEGAGGWYAPITDELAISDLALALNLPVILVVAIKLGCINHAKLSYQAIIQSGLPCAGWIAVCLEPNLLHIDDNIKTIQGIISDPLLGILPYMAHADFDTLSLKLNLAKNNLL